MSNSGRSRNGIVTRCHSQWLAETKDQIPLELITYWNYRDEIATIDGLMFKELKIIIPKKLRNKML